VGGCTHLVAQELSNGNEAGRTHIGATKFMKRDKRTLQHRSRGLAMVLKREECKLLLRSFTTY
jgi:hypothetical protein